MENDWNKRIEELEAENKRLRELVDGARVIVEVFQWSTPAQERWREEWLKKAEQAMNPLNYASLEASKRLVEAGIVLETERYFHIFDEEVHDYTAEQKKIWEGEVRRGNASPEAIFIPRPSMAEVWRELPETALQPCRDTTTGYCHEYLSLQKDGDLTVAGYGEYSEIGRNSNPTDAMIDLLIWVRKEASHGGR